MPDFYKPLRPFLMRIDPERGHELVLRGLGRLQAHERLLKAGWRSWGKRTPRLPIEVFGRKFVNPVGLAAGFDKDAAVIPAVEAMGFGFIEVGTVTPAPQAGNPKKRIFRVAEDLAIVNSLGFNSRGIEHFQKQLIQQVPRLRSALLGINIGKNTSTPPERAVNDYLYCMTRVYRQADYISLNISSPNSPRLRDLQRGGALDELLEAIMESRRRLSEIHDGRWVSMAIKISPDLDASEICSIADNAMRHKVDAIIATNTTTTRPNSSHRHYAKPGGMSGEPLRELSTEIIKSVFDATAGSIPIIGVGGISTAADAWEKMCAGATLVQIYSSLVYNGPAVIRELVAGLADYVSQHGNGDLAEALSNSRRIQTDQ